MVKIQEEVDGLKFGLPDKGYALKDGTVGKVVKGYAHTQHIPSGMYALRTGKSKEGFTKTELFHTELDAYKELKKRLKK